MCLAECIASAARGVPRLKSSPIERLSDVICDMPPVNPSLENPIQNEKTGLLDSLRSIIEGTKQHFNANYRFQVCEKILDAAASVVNAGDVPLVNILHFISNLPRDVTNIGPLRFEVQKWLLNEEKCSSSCKSQILGFLTSLTAFPENFVCLHQPLGGNVTYDDDDVDLWQTEADRWARVTFLLIENQHVRSIYDFIQDHGSTLIKENNQLRWVPVKFLILVLSLVQELQVYQRRIADDPFPKSRKTEHEFPSTENHIHFVEQSSFLNFGQSLLSIADNLVSFAKISSSIWWSSTVEGENILPNAVKGRLGGPSQRRLSSFATTQVLEAIIAVKCLAAVLGWCGQMKLDSSLDCVTSFLWDFCWKMVTSPLGRSEAKAELSLAGHEAMTHALKALVPVFSPLSLHLISEGRKSLLSSVNHEQVLDSFVQTFLQNVNDLISAGDLLRTRRAILMNWKWNCLESLLSIPKSALKNGVGIRNSNYFFSQNTMRLIFDDLVESLENAGEASVLPILRSVRLVVELFASGRSGAVVSSCDGITAQMMWDLVNPCWILHASCTKRRVAPIAALLSSVLHSSVFNDVNMHQSDGTSGPLKWFIGKILDVGSKSPRTTRLAALHLTGLWLKYPITIKFYMNELKLLTMYGSVAFDEDFEAELTENQEAKSEVAVLAQSPDPELTAEFVNTELYARVSVAALFYKLSDIAGRVGSVDENEVSWAALVSGQMFLLELLQFALNDKDLSKELYKKYSAIHRRKIRVWQMICVLVRFANQEIVETVTCFLHKALQKNNMPSVRQYLETFAIHIYLKFPLLVGQQLVPLLRNYDIRPQTLSSYIYIAANVILHADKSIKSSHLAELFPPIIPMLTSHHHTLRGFAQLLVYQILQKLLPDWDTDASVTLSLPKRCLEDLKSYLTCNPDCARLRASMEGYIDSFDPKEAVTPAGIFSDRVEELNFECVPKNLMEQVITFLNDARDDLRGSMAKDAAAIRNEALNGNDYSIRTEKPVDSDGGASLIHQQNGVTSDFQKKFTLSKYKMLSAGDLLMDDKESLESFVGIEKEDQLLEQLLSSRSAELQKLREGRQPFILVASFIDRIPNLAGLARTCEVFRAAGLAIADKNISKDKQFQLISVTAEKWIPLIEVPVSSVKTFLEKKKHEGFAILGLEQTANSTPLDQYVFPRKTVLVLGKEKEGIPVEIIHVLDACIEIPQLGIIRSLNVHVSGAIAMWEYTRQQRLR